MSGTRRRPGLLGPHVQGYQGWLLDLGYTPATVRNMLKERKYSEVPWSVQACRRAA